ncbi:MAG: alpha/beta fold hydrolase [Pseudomonadota bacterium]
MSIKIIQLFFKVAGFISPYIAGNISFYIFCHIRASSLRNAEVMVMNKSKKSMLTINNKKVTTYEWSEKGEPVLLVHGWESRASRYYKFIDKLIENGYRPISFDAPAHGESSGKATTILEFAEIIKQLQQKYGNYAGIIAHSFGVLSTFYAVKNGVKCKKIVSISGVTEFEYLVDVFSTVLMLNNKTKRKLRRRVEQLFGKNKEMWKEFSAYTEPEKIMSDVLVIHDSSDIIVNISQANKLLASLKSKASLLQTESLGHKRILSDAFVVDSSIEHLRSC